MAMSKLVEFGDLDYSDEIIIDPLSLKDDENIIVFTKFKLSGNGADVGVSQDKSSKYTVQFGSTQKVLKVFARRADKV